MAKSQGVNLARDSKKGSRKRTKAESRIRVGTFEDAFSEIVLFGVRSVAESTGEFTEDDISAWIFVYCMAFKAPDPRFIANVIRSATKDGICSPTNKTKKGSSTKSVRIWKSLLHDASSER